MDAGARSGIRRIDVSRERRAFIELKAGDTYLRPMETLSSNLLPIAVFVYGTYLVVKDLLDAPDVYEKLKQRFRSLADFGNRSAIAASIYTRRLSARILVSLWALFTGKPIITDGDDLPPTPRGGRRSRTGPIAFVGYRTDLPASFLAAG